MIAHRSVAEAPLQGVPDHAAVGTRSRRVHPQVRALRLQEVVQLALRYARLNSRVRQRLAEVDDTSPPAEIEQDCVSRGSLRAISPGFDGGDRVEREAG